MTKSRFTIHINGKTVLMDFDLGQSAQKHIHEYLTHGLFYEADTVAALQRVLRPGDTFIDVGAHVGYFSMLAASLVGPMGKVVAFEPDFTNADAFRENQKLNDAEHVKLLCNVVGRECGLRQFWINSDNDGGHALWDVGLHDFNTKSKANPNLKSRVMLSLDYCLSKGMASTVKAIKIDTEGSEMEILKGAVNLLKANPECVIICEINRYALGQMGSSEPDLRTFMEKEMGYQCWLIEEYPVDGKYTPTQPSLMPFGMSINSLNVFNVMFKK